MKKKSPSEEKTSTAHMTTNWEGVRKQDAVEVGGAVTGALIGLALGGPLGSVVGAATAPGLSIAARVVAGSLERRRVRAERVINQAFEAASMEHGEAIAALESNEKRSEDFLTLLRIIAESDSSVDTIIVSLLGKSLTAEDHARERLLIIGDAIRHLRPLHLHILEALHKADGTLSAHQIAIAVNIPEMELRSVVRELELRGMIKDTGLHPVEWKLRELGESIVQFANK